jgi:CubicO group peptidase (beta-lactamase class C family)
MGHRDIEKKANDFSLDTTTWIASMSKLIIGVSIMQLVDRKLVSLDEPVSTYLDEFKSCTIITAMDPNTNEPTTIPSPRPPTVRELLTHSSGLAYIAMHPLLTTYWTSHLNRGPTPSTNSSVLHEHSHPLVFAPASSWTYGGGADWAGRLIERVTSAPLTTYIQTHILLPLSLPSTALTFRPLQDPSFLSTLATRPMRDPTGSGRLVPDTTGTFGVIEPEDDTGGAGLYGSAPAYAAVLRSLLRDDGALLSAAARAELFRPCLSPEAEEAFNAAMASPFRPFLGPGYPEAGAAEGARGEKVRYSWSVGGAVIVNEGGVEGVAGKGMAYWSGLPNCSWFVDEERGVAGVWVANLLPPGDPLAGELYRAWREALWEEREDASA